MAYGVVSRVKVDWLNLGDSGSDTRIENFIELADRKIDNILTPFVTVPLTGAAITDSVKRFSEQCAAGLILMARANDIDDYERGKDIEDRAKKDIEAYGKTIAESGFVVVCNDYLTEPLRND